MSVWPQAKSQAEAQKQLYEEKILNLSVVRSTQGTVSESILRQQLSEAKASVNRQAGELEALKSQNGKLSDSKSELERQVQTLLAIGSKSAAPQHQVRQPQQTCDNYLQQNNLLQQQDQQRQTSMHAYSLHAPAGQQHQDAERKQSKRAAIRDSSSDSDPDLLTPAPKKTSRPTAKVCLSVRACMRACLRACVRQCVPVPVRLRDCASASLCFCSLMFNFFFCMHVCSRVFAQMHVRVFLSIRGIS